MQISTSPKSRRSQSYPLPNYHIQPNFSLQVRWIQSRKQWISAANDDMVRLWAEDGSLVHSFRYKGGCAQCLFVDQSNELLLLATLDMNVSVFVLDHPMPIATYIHSSLRWPLFIADAAIEDTRMSFGASSTFKNEMSISLDRGMER